MELLREKGLDDVLVVVGGIIPDVDIPKLKAMGISGIFLPGTPMQEIVDFINAQRGAVRARELGRQRSQASDRTRCCSPTTASRSSASSS